MDTRSDRQLPDHERDTLDRLVWTLPLEQDEGGTALEALRRACAAAGLPPLDSDSLRRRLDARRQRERLFRAIEPSAD